jgi:hypothetical protein
MNDIPEGLLQLQQEVPENLIGKLPKVTCPACRRKENRGQCNEHQKQRCQICDGWISPAHTHLDYVGHAETTSKLLEVDPLWNWEPLAFGTDGLPAFDADGGLWIRLTVCGVTRLGYGTADNANGFKARGDLRKEIIGDAIRNAAMRFGWALNLWAKTDIHERTLQEETAQQDSVQHRPQQQRGPQQRPQPADADQKRNLAILIGQKLGPTAARNRHNVMSQRFQRRITSFDELTWNEAAIACRELSGMRPYQPPQPPAPASRYGELHQALEKTDLEGFDGVIHQITEARDAGQITPEEYQQLSEFADGLCKALVADASGERDWPMYAPAEDEQQPAGVGV